MNEYLTVGKIVNTHGVKGELKVIPMTSDINRFDYLKFVWLEMEGKLTEYFVEKVRYHKNFVLVKLRGIENMDQAAALKERFLKVNRKHARPLEEDEYFIADLVDCDVYEKETYLGKITDVLQTGGNDVYVVNGGKYGEVLIPAIRQVVREVDIESKKVWVELPEGLVEQ